MTSGKGLCVYVCVSVWSVCVCVCVCVRMCICVKEYSFLSSNFCPFSSPISGNKFLEIEVYCQYIHSCFRIFSCLGKYKRNEEYVSCSTIC